MIVLKLKIVDKTIGKILRNPVSIETATTSNEYEFISPAASNVCLPSTFTTDTGVIQSSDKSNKQDLQPEVERKKILQKQHLSIYLKKDIAEYRLKKTRLMEKKDRILIELKGMKARSSEIDQKIDATRKKIEEIVPKLTSCKNKMREIEKQIKYFEG